MGRFSIVYKFKDKWYVGTRSRSEADGNIDGDENLNFAKLFDIAVHSIYVRNWLDKIIHIVHKI